MISASDDEIVADAQAYPTRTAWKAGSPRYYCLVHRKRRHLKERCTAWMGPPQGPRYAGYEIYIYRFADGDIYIGLTSSSSRRHCFHRTVGVVAKKGLPWRVRVLVRGLSLSLIHI
jgi:hypothetical protein